VNWSPPLSFTTMLPVVFAAKTRSEPPPVITVPLPAGRRKMSPPAPPCRTKSGTDASVRFSVTVPTSVAPVPSEARIVEAIVVPAGRSAIWT
jgi:hypothetical protein